MSISLLLAVAVVAGRAIVGPIIRVVEVVQEDS